MASIERSIEQAQLEMLSRQLNMQNNAQFQQMAAMAAQQAQQSYANLDMAQAQQSYSHGWTDPTMYVFGGNDPQRAYKEIPNDPESIAKHLLSERHFIKPVSAKKKVVFFISLGVTFMGILLAIKLIGVV